MWQILKAEFRYTRDAVIFAYAVAVLFLIAAINIDGWGFYNFMWNTTISYFILMGILGFTTINEKRYRLFTMLPLQPRDIALVDGVYILLVQLGMSLLWILYLLFRPDEIQPGTVWLIMANNALILTILTLFGTHYHAGFFETKKYQRLNWLILLLVIIAIVMIYDLTNMNIIQLVWTYYASAAGAFVLILVWIGVSVVSGLVYVRRKSYLA
jgi:hypothetical protein